MLTGMPLPSQFALFDADSRLSVLEPNFLQSRFALFEASGEFVRPFAPVTHLVVKRSDPYLADPIQRVGDLVWWRTAWELRCEGRIVPILDMEPRIETLFQYTATNDFVGYCLSRIQDQRALRQQKMALQQEMARQRPQPLARPPQPSRPPTVCEIPAFVAELIVKDAIAKKAQCPILMKEFNDCKTVVVTTCYHTFESEALKEWLAMKTTCPLCKAEVKGFRPVTLQTASVPTGDGSGDSSSS
jgi:hypothetical protein